MSKELDENFVDAIKKGDIRTAEDLISVSGLSDPSTWLSQYILLSNIIPRRPSILIKNLLLSEADKKIGTEFLVEAMIDENEEVANFLIRRKNIINVNARYNGGYTLLHIAAMLNFPTVVECLCCTFDIDIDAENEEGSTALHLAAVHDDGDIISSLLGHGATCSLKDKDGCTALHIAVDSNIQTVIDILLDYGADLSATCNSNLTPLEHDPDSKILKEHIIAMKVLNRYVSNQNLNCIDLDGADREIFEHYKKNVAELKNQKIEDSNISVYDFLTCRVNRLASYVGNPKLVRAAKRSWPRPWYNDFRRRIEMGKNRKLLLPAGLESCEIAVSALFGNGLSDVHLAYDITDYLSNNDLKNLIIAAPSSDGRLLIDRNFCF